VGNEQSLPFWQTDYKLLESLLPKQKLLSKSRKIPQLIDLQYFTIIKTKRKLQMRKKSQNAEGLPPYKKYK
jgi:hypothetical protein